MSRFRSELESQLAWSRLSAVGAGVVWEGFASGTHFHDHHLIQEELFVEKLEPSDPAIPATGNRPHSRPHSQPCISNLHVTPKMAAEQAARREARSAMQRHGSPPRGTQHLVPLQRPATTQGRPSVGTPAVGWRKLRPETAPNVIHETPAFPAATARSSLSGPKTQGKPLQPTPRGPAWPPPLELPADPQVMSRAEREMTYEQARLSAWNKEGGYSNTVARTFRLGATRLTLPSERHLHLGVLEGSVPGDTGQQVSSMLRSSDNGQLHVVTP